MQRTLATLILSATACAAAAAGPLNPPSGAVGSTGKTLTELEPRIAISAINTPGDADSQFRITAAGSYYLTGNIVGVANKKAIEIQGSNISIDLNGFTIQGTGGATAGDGINIDTVATSGTVVVRNGSITQCRTGVNMPLNYGSIKLDDLTVSFCTSSGAIVNNGSARSCHFRSNTFTGLLMTSVFSAENCTSSSNTGSGFSATQGLCMLRGCTASGNGADGFDTPFCVINECQAISNAQIGFDRPSLITNSYALGGITPLAMSGGVATGCTAEGGSADGITATARSRISNCRVFGAGQNGIRATGAGCTIKDCTVNSCGTSSGAFAGIKVDSTDCLVSDNHVSQMTTGGDDVGIWVVGIGNMIVRNAVTTANDWYNIAAGNAAGPEIGSAAVATTTNPMANIGF
ncbi:MAG: hypothetical protein Q8L55_14800 [Phycisphaerales bacterium]|nr:hypothetical protein [Phycisphaerales bacterium]